MKKKHFYDRIGFYAFRSLTTMNSTAAIQMAMPTRILAVIGSANISVPTSMPVRGSNTPKTAVFVGPINRVDIEMVSMEIIVGKMAKPMRLNTSDGWSMPLRIGVPSMI